MKDVADLLPRVYERAPQCPEPTALRHLVDAAREFCRATRIWRSTDEFPIEGEDCEIVAVEHGTALYEITHARLGDTDLVPVTIDWLDKNRPGWRTADPAPPRWLTQSAPDTVRVVPAPEESGTLHLSLILEPAESADRLPDFLIDSYGRVIADGALGSILMLPVEWADGDRAAVHEARFRDELARWSDRVPRGQMRAKRRTKPASMF